MEKYWFSIYLVHDFGNAEKKPHHSHRGMRNNSSRILNVYQIWVPEISAYLTRTCPEFQ